MTGCLVGVVSYSAEYIFILPLDLVRRIVVTWLLQEQGACGEIVCRF